MRAVATPGRLLPSAVEGGLLMRVLAVAQGLHALGGDGEPLGEGSFCCLANQLAIAAS
jgi:hypothetical protein